MNPGEIEHQAWGSHLPAVMACLASTVGPVLELGVGHVSTPVLHAYCLAAGRHLVSVEQNSEWFELFRSKYEQDGHEFIQGKYASVVPKFWAFRSVALIDNSPGGSRRRDDFWTLLPKSEFVIVHDYLRENEEAIAPLLDGVDHFVCRDYDPPTLVASLTMKIPKSLISVPVKDGT